jgi:2-alkyl-3-oxoalkanoate reductase
LQIDGFARQSKERNMNKLQVAVTGAAGLVGSHLVEFLAKQGYPVVAVCRTRPTEPFAKAWAQMGVRVVEANVTDQKSMTTALSGADIVVHAAAIVDPFGSRDLIFKTNVEGTQNTIAAALANQVKQFILISSLSVITGRKDQFETREDAPYQPCGEAYADSKIAAEEAVRVAIKKEGLPATILRPGFIYGPREKAWLPRLINSIATGKAVLVDGGNRETNVIYVENLNRAVGACIGQPAALGQIYNLTDGPGITKKQLFDAISNRLNLPPVTRNVPAPVVRTFCECISTIAPLLPVEKQRGLARYSRAAFRLVGQNQGFSIKKAEKELGYVDRIPFAEGMAQTLAYVADQKGTSVATPSSKVAAG